MIGLLAAVLLASSQAAPPAQATSAVTIVPAPDTPQQRQALRKLTICVAGLRPNWARAVMAHPYLSEQQASAAAQVFAGHDNCIGVPGVDVAFRTSGVVGSVAEYFVRSDLAKTDPQRLANALATVAPLNVSEDFALCVASRNPKAAVDLAFSEPGSAVEASASGLVVAAVPSCTKPNEQIDVDVQAMRSMIATALYRGVTAAAGK